MKILRPFLLLFSLLAGALAPAQTFPTASSVSVSANPTTGALKGPTNFFTGNATALAAVNAPYRNALAPAQATYFFGAAGSTFNVPGPGTGNFTVAFDVNENSAAQLGVISGGTNALQVDLNYPNTGYVAVTLSGISHGPNANVGLVAGKTNRIIVIRENGVVTFLRDGTEYAGGADTTDYSAAFTTIGSAGGYFAGTFRLIGILNFALSAAERLQVNRTGLLPATVWNNAANTSEITGNDSDFTSDTGYWTKSGATISAGVATLSSGGYILRELNRNVGARYRLIVDLTSIASGNLQINTGNNPVNITGATNGGSYIYDYVCDGAAPLTVSSPLGSAVLNGVSHVRLGALLAPDPNAPGNGLVQLDTSGNGAHIVRPATSTSWAVPGNGPNQVRGTTSTSGNQQLLGTYTLDASTRVTAIYARSRSGTPTVKFGTASGGAELGTATAISTTWTPIPLGATTVTSAVSSIWVNSTTTDVVETNLFTVPLSF